MRCLIGFLQCSSGHVTLIQEILSCKKKRKLIFYNSLKRKHCGWRKDFILKRTLPFSLKVGRSLSLTESTFSAHTNDQKPTTAYHTCAGVTSHVTKRLYKRVPHSVCGVDFSVSFYVTAFYWWPSLLFVVYDNFFLQSCKVVGEKADSLKISWKQAKPVVTCSLFSDSWYKMCEIFPQTYHLRCRRVARQCCT